MKVVFLLLMMSLFININGQKIRNKIFFGISDSNSYEKNDKIIFNLPYNTDGRFINNENPAMDNLLNFLKKIKEKNFEIQIEISYCYSNISEYNFRITESLKKSIELIFKKNNISVESILSNGCQESLLEIKDNKYKQMGASNLILTIR